MSNLLCALNTQNVISIATASISLVAMLISCIALILTCKQFKSNMKKQEQSIALSMLDRRLAVLDYFENVQYTVDDAIEGIMKGKHAMIDQFYMLFSDKLLAEYESIQAFRENDIANIAEQRREIYYQYLTPPPGATEDILKEITYKRAQLKTYENNAFNIGSSITQKNEFRAYASKILGGNDDYFNLTTRFVELNALLKQKEAAFIQHLSDEIRLSIR